MTIALGAIVLSFAIPSYQNFIVNQRLEEKTSNFMGTIQLARQEAIKRSTPVGVCPLTADQQINCNGGNWALGWGIFVDNNRNNSYDNTDTILSLERPMENGLAINAAQAIVFYDASGFLAQGNGNFQFFSQNCVSDRLYQINLSNLGRPSLQRGTCNPI